MLTLREQVHNNQQSFFGQKIYTGHNKYNSQIGLNTSKPFIFTTPMTNVAASRFAGAKMVEAKDFQNSGKPFDSSRYGFDLKTLGHNKYIKIHNENERTGAPLFGSVALRFPLSMHQQKL